MQSRTFGSWVLSIDAAAAFSLASSAAAQMPSLPAVKGAPAPARGAVPADIFQPPPVPGFMLRAPEKPLTQEEMLREAEEAAAKARQPSQPERATTPDAASPAQLQNTVK